MYNIIMILDNTYFDIYITYIYNILRLINLICIATTAIYVYYIYKCKASIRQHATEP